MAGSRNKIYWGVNILILWGTFILAISSCGNSIAAAEVSTVGQSCSPRQGSWLGRCQMYKMSTTVGKPLYKDRKVVV
ncbi:hypothetical protein V8C42DRAFT_333384, partial [Trichoderma barbatum]